MKRRLCHCVLLPLLLLLPACKSSQATSQLAPTQQPQPNSSATQSEELPKDVSEVFIDRKTLSYNGYKIIKLTKKVKYEYPPEIRSDPQLIDVNYTVIKRHGMPLVEFDGVHYGLGNSNQIGLFPFLGGDTNQLVISQTVPRGGRHWIIDLSSDVRVIFDSQEWGVGREEVWMKDLDNDGMQEIFLADPSFYMVFRSLSMSETPLPETVFKYDRQAGKYLPANHIFRDYALKGINDEVQKLKPEGERGYLSSRLDILLRYIYAGREEEGWSFFDREYKLEDKDEVKSKVKAVLEGSAFYKFIYGRKAT